MHPKHPLGRGIEGLQVSRSEERAELVEDLVVVQLLCQLQQLGRLICILRWGVLHRLPSLVTLRPVALDDLLRDVVDHGLLIDERGGVKHITVYALLHHLSDSGLRQAPRIHRLNLLLGGLSPLNERRLHLHYDGAVVGYLVYRAGHYGVHDADVPGP